MKLFLILVSLLACQVFGAPSRDSSLSVLKSLETKKTTTIIVSVRGSNVEGLRRDFQLQTFSTRSQKLNSFYEILKGHADSTQRKITSFLNQVQLKKPIIAFRQIWLSNQIIVRDVDLETAQALLNMDEVDEIMEDTIYPRSEPRPGKLPVPQEGEWWGVRMIQAPKVWATGNKGAGSVIGTIDSGVRWTHEALREGFRTPYGWFDPRGYSAEPYDEDGHGTHTAGTIAGRANGIGVAPEAQWISCKGCGITSCPYSDLLACGDWHACPTDTLGQNPDCSKAANAVSNSWGGGVGDDFYDAVVKGWTAVEIAPIFSIGNSGPECGSANSPGDSAHVIGVGSTTSENGLSEFSSVGPTVRGHRIKPDVSAPGSDIVSSIHTADDAYASYSGTSMASPHVAGASALLYSVNPNLTVAQLQDLLQKGAEPIVSTGVDCGSISEGTYPNHHAGYGRINAANSAARLTAML